MTEEGPNRDATILLLHGEEQVGLQAALQEVIHSQSAGEMTDLNLTRLDGGKSSLSEVANHVQLLPLGAEGRLVIIRDPLKLVKSKEDQEKFIGLLDHLPPTTRLVLVVEDFQITRQGQKFWVVLDKERWFKAWLGENKEKVKAKEFINPSPREMAAWVIKTAEEMGAKLEEQAAFELTNAVGNDTLLANQELLKLQTYTAGERAITAEDVRLLVSPVGREDIFALADAIAEGNAKIALKLLEVSLQKQPVAMLFPMIVRQFRLLIVAAEIVSEGGTLQTVQHEMNIAEWLAQKYMRQARRFSLPELEGIYQRLAALDAQMKESHIPDELALEMFVVQMAKK